MSNGIRKRSRNGCLSCKSLKIKCSETKPSCEYCVHTQRICQYPKPKPLKKDLKKSKLSKIDTEEEIIIDIDKDFSLSSELFGSSEVQLLKKNLQYYYEKPFQHDILTRNLVLTQATSMLNISRFELRLLNFFDNECINLFSYGINEGIHNTWKYKVPYLFLESELVRQSIFSFAALGLSTTFELDVLQDIDSIDSDTNFKQTFKFDQLDKSNIFLTTTTYFLEVLTKTRNIMSNSDLKDPPVAKELTVSSVLLFAFLAVHPHKMVPLINFNKDNETADLLSIAKGVRYTIVECGPTILNSELSGLLFYRGIDKMDPPSLNKCQFPIIRNLMDDLYKFNDHEHTISKDAVIEESIDLLMKAIYGVSFFKFPVPLYRWLMIISDQFRELLYLKHPFGLKVLYIHSALSSIARFQFYNDHNIWRDYMIWYLDNGYFTGDDHYLSYLCIEKHFLIEDFTKFPEFDPELEYKKLINSE
ncbi:unnamed protein product [Candida verbasci]|uniref:Zn(2)-C6 fungal-type domain-containing protein n=1 Tax=Candida verbasci TaxID=1227364 RepID=A0A9W4XCJ9_9ASCO|nr:unnamed protein product [Candida verbasci]